MKIEDVKKMEPIDRFFYWCSERDRIYRERRKGKPHPWTDDDVLSNYFFTNPYRENDKVTVWFKNKYREEHAEDIDVVMGTIIFRWFNYIPTGKFFLKYNYLNDWKHEQVVRRLTKRRDKGIQIFTGAFMINSPPGIPKMEAICDRVNQVWEDRSKLYKFVRDNYESPECSMEDLHLRLMEYEGLGGFMAYEVVCDLRYTIWLEDAVDKLTWANPGPGAIRGLYRLEDKEWGNKGNNASSPKKPDNALETMVRLLQESYTRLKGMPRFELREIEHSLCEWDKYERLLWGDGRAKRKYVPSS